MEIFKEPFGKLSDGTEVFRWNLINENGLTAKVLDYGATIQSMIVPDKNGNPVDASQVVTNVAQVQLKRRPGRRRSRPRHD